MVEATTTDTAPAEEVRKLTARWHYPEILDKGFVAVPARFLQIYSTLKPSLTSGEALFVIQLMSFKWSEKAPFPGYGTIAKRMGLSDKAVRRHAAALENKGYLRRIARVGDTNRFDLSPLFDALRNEIVKPDNRGGQSNG
jgi:hypothetical protein